MKNLKFLLGISKSFKDLVGFTCKLSLNNNGFTMLEVMIASGLMGVAALGMMQLQKSSSDGQIIAQNNMEIFQLQQTLKQNFLNHDTCFATLKTRTDLDVVFTAVDDETLIKPMADGIIFESRDVDGLPIAGSRKTIMKLDDEFNGGRIKMTDFGIYSLDKTGTAASALTRSVKHQLVLRVGFERKKSKQVADGDGAKKFSFVTIDVMVGTGNGGTPEAPAIPSGTIEKCYSAEGNAVITAMRASCLSIDIDGVNGPDNEFDMDTLLCNPKYNEGYCVYGGSYANSTYNQAKYPNPVSGIFDCSNSSFTKVKTGHFMRPEAYSCGKLQCYRFHQQTQITCLKCYGDLDGDGNGEPGVHFSTMTGAVPGYRCDSLGNCGSAGGGLAPTGVAYCTDVTCATGEYPMDNNGDGCDDTCFDPSSISGPTP